MAVWNICSAAGLDLGNFQGDTKAEALLEMFRDMGRDENSVWLEDDEFRFAGEEYDEDGNPVEGDEPNELRVRLGTTKDYCFELIDED